MIVPLVSSLVVGRLTAGELSPLPAGVLAGILLWARVWDKLPTRLALRSFGAGSACG
jgi:hypothetical protein